MGYSHEQWVMWLEQQMDAIMCALASTNAGSGEVVSVTVDGTTTSFRNRESAEQRLEWYRKKYFLATGRLARSRGINLSHGGPQSFRGSLPPEAG